MALLVLVRMDVQRWLCAVEDIAVDGDRYRLSYWRCSRCVFAVEQENTGHRHEEIFLPLSVVEHGTVEGLLIDDMEPEKGPLVIEEIIDDTGMITNVIIERASDLSVENLEKSKRMNRKIGLVDEMPPPSEKVIKGDERRNRSWLLLVVLLVTVAFSMGFVLSVSLFGTFSKRRRCNVPESGSLGFLYQPFANVLWWHRCYSQATPWLKQEAVDEAKAMERRRTSPLQSHQKPSAHSFASNGEENSSVSRTARDRNREKCLIVYLVSCFFAHTLLAPHPISLFPFAMRFEHASTSDRQRMSRNVAVNRRFSLRSLPTCVDFCLSCAAVFSSVIIFQEKTTPSGLLSFCRQRRVLEQR